MKFKNKFLMSVLMLLVLMTVSAVSAGENTTNIVSVDDNAILSDEEELDFNAEIISQNYTLQYDKYVNDIGAQIKDSEGNYLENEDLRVRWDDGSDEFPIDDSGSYYYFDAIKSAGNHKVKIFLADSIYSADPVIINVKITKAPAQIYVKKPSISINSQATLKAVVKDEYGDYIKEGTVKFTIDGKSYDVKVKNGVASKNIRLANTKHYSYKATFSSNNYKTVSKSSGIYNYVVSKRDRTFNIKGYQVVLSLNQYKKLIYAKHNNKLVCFNVKTSKIIKQTYEVHYKQTSWKFMGIVSRETAHRYGWKPVHIVKHWVSDGEYYTTCSAYKKVVTDKVAYKTVNARVYMQFYYGGENGGQSGLPHKYSVGLTTNYQNPGYDLVGNCWVSGIRISNSLKTLNTAKVRTY